MAITIQPLNAPYDVIESGDGRIAAFARITFTADAVTNPDVGGGGASVAGQTYDPTSHITSRLWLAGPGAAGVSGKLKDYWQMTYVDQIEIGTSSDVEATSGVANSTTGQVKARFVELGVTPALSQYLELRVVGAGNVDPLTRQDETELDGTADTLSSLSFDCLIHGFGRSSRGQA